MKPLSRRIHWLLILALLAAPVQGVFAAIAAADAHDHAVMMCHGTMDDASAISGANADQDDGTCHSMSHCCGVFFGGAPFIVAAPANDFSPGGHARLYLIDLPRLGEPPRSLHA
ncbi:MAG: DUF2946 family protein [Pseudomonadota bacterium]